MGFSSAFISGSTLVSVTTIGVFFSTGSEGKFDNKIFSKLILSLSPSNIAELVSAFSSIIFIPFKSVIVANRFCKPLKVILSSKSILKIDLGGSFFSSSGWISTAIADII